MNNIEKEVTIQGKVAIRGTLAIPENQMEKNPAILIIVGSGKLDRNGKVSEKLDLGLYRQIAEYLTSIGYITLRYDKRGVGQSEGDYLATGMWDLVDDAISAVQYLKSLPNVDAEKVIVLGHSEGSTLGTAVAAREDLGGLILLSGAVERLSEALKRQRDLAIQDILEAKGFQGFILRLLGAHKKVEPAAQKAIDKTLNSKEDVIRMNMVKTNARWMREHFQYDVLEDLVKVTCPVIAITGARDIQANPSVLKDLPNYVKGDSEYYVIENMGHSCKYTEQTSNMFNVRKDLAKEGILPVHPELLSLINGWLNKHYPSSQAIEPVIS